MWAEPSSCPERASSPFYRLAIGVGRLPWKWWYQGQLQNLARRLPSSSLCSRLVLHLEHWYLSSTGCSHCSAKPLTFPTLPFPGPFPSPAIKHLKSSYLEIPPSTLSPSSLPFLPSSHLDIYYPVSTVPPKLLLPKSLWNTIQLILWVPTVFVTAEILLTSSKFHFS